MAEPEGTAGIDATAEVKAPIDVETAPGADDEFDEAPGSEDADDAAEPPRRRLVAELLEGQEVVDEAPRGDLQLVAPPLHLETIDAGQPIYQLDLSSDEPRGEIVEPAPLPGAGDAAATVAPDPSDASSPLATDAGARGAVKQMIVQRDRQVMAAERDGIGAYELAVGLDHFVEAVLEAARSDDR